MTGSIQRIETDDRSSRVVIYNGIVSIGGMTAPDRTGDIGNQTQQILDRIDGYLEQAGTDKSRLLTTQIFLKNIQRDFAAMNEVWNAWTAPDESPTRATVQSEMAKSDILIEVIVTAAVASS